MAMSPEEYLSGVTFNADAEKGSADLDAGERAFIEKYLGSDMLAHVPVQDPEPLPLPKLAPKVSHPPLPVREPEIVIARLPAKEAISAPALPEILVATPQTEAKEVAKAQDIPAKTEIQAQTEALTDIATEEPCGQKLEATVEDRGTQKNIDSGVVRRVAATTPEIKNALASREERKIASELAFKEETTLREKMRHAPEIQMVSFFVADQLFLLPVAGIQEVVRHMDLIKVPQAPDFIAGAINLRGTVMPLIRLSSLLTNEPDIPYDKKNFIIITGSEKLRMGLIIDRVSSMHMIPQAKIIWNAESKLGEAAEFLSAIVDLDDRVCGMVAPDAIAQKILPELAGL